MVSSNARLTVADRDRLLGYLEGGSVSILPEPQVLLTATPKVPGLDGRKMSKSYGNTIGLREDPDEVAKKLKTMQTDPARVRRTDPGNPDICPVFDLHKIYSSDETRAWAANGCRTAGIGCLECKKPLIDKVVEEIGGIRKRAQEFEENPELVRNIVAEGAEKAREARARHAGRRAACHELCAWTEGEQHGKKAAKPDLRVVVDNSPSETEGGEAVSDKPSSPEQVEMPFAIVNGEAITQLPKDLYIPPQALEVFLDAFEGPLDLLLYMIRRQNLDILDIPIADITKQYMEYIGLMADMQLEHRRRIPGDGRHAGRDQVAHAAAARRRSECRRRG